MFSSAIVTANAMAWLLYFYSPPPNAVDAGVLFLAVGVLVGLARLLGSAVDAVTNPLVAFWSDRSRNPRGRRIPFVRQGTLPLMLFAILVWFPPVRGASDWNVVWLAVTLSTTWFFYTYVVAPYLALMPEITSNPQERVSLTVTMSYFEAAAMVIAALLVPVVIEKCKHGVQLGPIWLADGFKLTAIALAILGGAGFFLAIGFIKEKKLAESSIPAFSLRQSIAACFRNPAFPPYLFAVACAKIAIGLVLISMPFVATAVLHKGEGFAAVLQAPLFVSTLIGFVVAQILVNRLGLKRSFRGAVLAALVITLGMFAMYFAGGRTRDLTSLVVLPDRDIVLRFGGEEAALSADKLAEEKLPRVSEEGDAVLVRMTHLEWMGLFRTMDVDGFHERVRALDEQEALGLLRADAQERAPTAGGGEGEGKKTREWLAGLDPEELLAVLKPDTAPMLFPESKRRFDEALYFAQPRLAGSVTPGEKVRLALDVGLVPPLEKTFNLAGWTTVFSTPEERSTAQGPSTWRLGPASPTELTGRISYCDGSIVFTDFTVAAGHKIRVVGAQPGSDGTQQAELLASRPGELDHLLSRFDLRVERAWSVRIWLMLGLIFLMGFPAAILMSMYRPIVCEIVDMDEKLVGTRREAMYFGVEGLLTKLADGVSALVAPAVMVLGHKIAPPPFGYVFTFATAAVFMLVAHAIFGRYPLNSRQ